MNDKGINYGSYGIAESSSTWQKLQNKTHRNYRRLVKKINMKRQRGKSIPAYYD